MIYVINGVVPYGRVAFFEGADMEEISERNRPGLLISGPMGAIMNQMLQSVKR